MPALAAARRNCDAVGVDYVPALLERGRRRADAEGLTVDFRVGDAEAPALPRRIVRRRRVGLRRDVAPDQRRTAAELLRLPAGRVGSASSAIPRRASSASSSGRTPATSRRRSARAAGPVGTEARLYELFGDGIRACAPSATPTSFRYRSPHAYRLLAHLLRPHDQGLEALDLPGQAARGGRPRPDRAFQPGRRRHHGRPERIPGGGAAYGHSRRAE